MIDGYDARGRSREGDVLDAEAFKALIRAAVAENLRSKNPS